MIENLKFKFLINSGFNFINNISNSNINKNEYLDPTSVLIILAINSYKPVGTKISICDNKMYFNDLNIFQSSIRTIYGDKKKDIKLLYQPLLYGCKIYKENTFKNFEILLNKSLEGLKKLKETYINDYDINICINNYIQILKSISQSEENVKFSTFYGYNDIFNIQDISDVDNIKEMIFNKLNSIWTSKKFKVVINLILELNDEDELYREKIIQSLYLLLDGINIKTKNILSKLFMNK